MQTAVGDQISPHSLTQTFVLFAIILIEGFVTISVEILTIRQVIPFVGNSVTVTSLIIGIFLLFLALGYKKGGSYQTHPFKVLKTNFALSAVLLGVGLSYVFLDLFFMGFRTYFGQNLLVGLTLYLLLITAPLIYFLGQTVPITMNLMKKDKTAGTIGGNVLYLSTLGSFLGAILTTLILMHIFGIANTIFINTCLLFGLILLISWFFDFNWLIILILTLASLFIYKLNHDFEQLMFVKTNKFANYRVIETNTVYDTPGKVLSINGSNSSYIDAQKRAFPYIEEIKTLLFQDLNLKNKNILVLGAGGFTLTAENTFGNQFTYVDIDPDLPAIVKQHFMPKTPDNIISADARQFLLQNESKWDVIILDAYSTTHEIPTHLVTKEYFQLVDSRIQPGGYSIFNIIAKPTLTDVYSKRIDNTIRAVFKQCMVVPLRYTEDLSNIIYACHVPSGGEDSDTTIYVDNSNQAEMDVSRKS